MHPLLSLMATRPQLLMDHAQAYVTLFREEFCVARNAWQTRLLWQAVALCGLGAAVVLGGVALMFWAVTPVGEIHALWALFAAPLVPLVIAAVCIRWVRQQSQSEEFANLTRQINADLAMLRAATPS
jgi:cytochrome bd-type quinol oxidase subunit 2